MEYKEFVLPLKVLSNLIGYNMCLYMHASMDLPVSALMYGDFPCHDSLLNLQSLKGH